MLRGDVPGVVKPSEFGHGLRRAVSGVLVLAAIGGFIWYMDTLLKADNRPVGPRPALSVVWGDRVPLSTRMQAQWLRNRGARYATWAKRHPAAARRLAREQAASRISP